MDNLMLLTKTSGHPASEVAETVPDVVQTASSGSIRLIGLVLIIMMFILALLTITLICIEIRQDTLRKLICSMAKRLERIEKRMIESSSEYEEEESVSAGNKRTTAKPPATTSLKSGPPVKRSSMSGTVPKSSRTTGSHHRNESRETPLATDTFPDTSSAHKRAETSASESRHTSTTPSYVAPPEKPYPLCGLRVNSSSYYNQNSPVSLDEVPEQEAVFILYSNMTVMPNNRLFNVYNNASYYTNNDFTMIFDFEDKEGYQVDMRRSLKCLKVARAATVINSQNGYLLEERGILIAEER